jgi:4-hydroxy-tetrahydrodipicolinate reductase
MGDTAAREVNGRVRVAVSGAGGRMGILVCQAVANDPDLSLVALVDPTYASGGMERAEQPQRFASLEEAIEIAGIEAVVDFTTPAVVRENVLTCVRRRVPVVVGTTGLSVSDLADIELEVEAHGTPVLVAPNFAMGAVLMMQFAQQAARYFSACEIVELHHDGKLDAPSGTSRLTRLRVEEAWQERGVEKDAPIHSVRLPGLVAHQEVIFGGLGETLTIRHDSLSRESFMPGVVLALKRVRGLQGLVVGLENIL